MSVAIQVFLRRTALPSIGEWNAALKAAGFDLVIDSFDLHSDDGYRPATSKGEDSGFEWYLSEVAKAEETPEYPFKAFIGDCDLRAQLLFISQAREEATAAIAGAVLAKLSGGYYWDPETDRRLLQGDEALAAARKIAAGNATQVLHTRDFNKIIKRHLLPHFPGFVASGRGEMVAVPLGHFWRVFGLGSKSYMPGTFYVSLEIVPLYVPAEENVYHSFGRRLRNNTLWPWDEQNPSQTVEDVVAAVKSEGLGLLNQLQTPLDLARNGPRLFSAEPWPYLEAFGYSCIYAERYAEALPWIEELHRQLASISDLDERDRQWLARTERIRMLLRTAPGEAKALLEQWEQQTIANLKLEKYL